MYARVAAFENPRFGDPSLVDELMSRTRDSAPRWRDELPAARGFLMLVDRESNRGLGITFFESEDAIREAEPVFDRMGDEIPEEMRGRRVSVDTYEVALHHAEEGAKAARVSTLEGAPDRLDDATRRGEEEILPQARQMRGWKGVISLIDRRSGGTKLITLWENEDALRASEEEADRLRRHSADAGGSAIRGVERYAVAFADQLSEVRAAR